MDMQIFQVEVNKVEPVKGKILISSPFLHDIHFIRSVILLIEHNEEGSVGLVMNKDFKMHIYLNDLIPDLAYSQRIPIYKGGPVSADTLFYLHRLKDLEGAIELSDGLYLNGDFEAVKNYIREGGVTEGVFRFFTGYAGWERGQLEHEIEENTWVVGSGYSELLLSLHAGQLWKNCLDKMGGRYALWATYPLYPILN